MGRGYLRGKESERVVQSGGGARLAEFAAELGPHLVQLRQGNARAACARDEQRAEQRAEHLDSNSILTWIPFGAVGWIPLGAVGWIPLGAVGWDLTWRSGLGSHLAQWVGSHLAQWVGIPLGAVGWDLTWRSGLGSGYSCRSESYESESTHHYPHRASPGSQSSRCQPQHCRKTALHLALRPRTPRLHSPHPRYPPPCHRYSPPRPPHQLRRSRLRLPPGV